MKSSQDIMFCDQVVELLEPIAAGDLEPDEAVERHLASCLNCAEALVSARRVDHLPRHATRAGRHRPSSRAHAHPLPPRPLAPRAVPRRRLQRGHRACHPRHRPGGVDDHGLQRALGD